MIKMIVATDINNAIGFNNQLLVRDKHDLQRFKKLTDGCIILMGRKTFESLPRLLPNREHWVLTKDKNYWKQFVGNDNVAVFDSVNLALYTLDETEYTYNRQFDMFVIGGGQIYEQFIDYADIIYKTVFNTEFKYYDTTFPAFDTSKYFLEEQIVESDNLERTYQVFIKKDLVYKSNNILPKEL